MLGILFSGLCIANSYCQVQSTNVDSVYNLISGNWYEVENCSGWAGCDSVYSTKVNKIERITGTDSITWKIISNDTLLSTSRFLITYSISYLYQAYKWMFTKTSTNGSIILTIRNLINVSTNRLSVDADANDGGGVLYSRTK
jgi:hypothetical protein